MSAAARTRPLTCIGSGFSWSDPRARAIAWQVLAAAAVVAIAAGLAIETGANLRARGIASGFDFLSRAAGFEIARGPIAFSSRDTYARALVVGLVNTLRLSLLGIVLAATLGVICGLARLSNIWVGPRLREPISKRRGTRRCCCSSCSGIRFRRSCPVRMMR